MIFKHKNVLLLVTSKPGTSPLTNISNSHDIEIWTNTNVRFWKKLNIYPRRFYLPSTIMSFKIFYFYLMYINVIPKYKKLYSCYITVCLKEFCIFMCVHFFKHTVFSSVAVRFLIFECSENVGWLNNAKCCMLKP